MAKLHKVEMYVTDMGEEVSNMSHHIGGLFTYSDVLVNHIETKEAARFPWDDNHILNLDSTTKADIVNFIHETQWLNDKLAKNTVLIKTMIKGILESCGMESSDRNLKALISHLYNKED